MKVSFVILHYKNLKDTKECIESIKQLETKEEISIIVVDNHTLSTDDKKMIEEYTKDIIENKENLGFAKANNIGCKKAIEKYHPDFICVINNDTVIKQKNFIEEIKKCYEETSFDMLGPKIITANGESVNPFPVYKTLEEVRERINYHEKLDKIYKNLFLRILLNLYMRGKRLVRKPIHLENGEKSEYGVGLHGCAIIFSKRYYQKYKDVFYNETFLYHEEEFLYYRKERDNLITYYDSNLEIIHKEGASLNESFKNHNYKKLIFRNQEILKSLYLLKDVMEKSKKI